MRFDRYDAMSFDCYGTLIDWETGILKVLRTWSERHDLNVRDSNLIKLFGEHERQVQLDTPQMLYPKVLAEVHRRIANALGVGCTDVEADALGASVGDWPVFLDTVPALYELKKSYKLFVLSNVDRQSFSKTKLKLEIEFDGIVTAEDVGSYKPDFKNFEAIKKCVESAGISPQKLIHVGESIFHDVTPATKASLATVWIDRQSGMPDRSRASGQLDGDIQPLMAFDSMVSFASAAAAR